MYCMYVADIDYIDCAYIVHCIIDSYCPGIELIPSKCCSFLHFGKWFFDPCIDLLKINYKFCNRYYIYL